GAVRYGHLVLVHDGPVGAVRHRPHVLLVDRVVRAVRDRHLVLVDDRSAGRVRHAADALLVERVVRAVRDRHLLLAVHRTDGAAGLPVLSRVDGAVADRVVLLPDGPVPDLVAADGRGALVRADRGRGVSGGAAVGGAGRSHRPQAGQRNGGPAEHIVPHGRL